MLWFVPEHISHIQAVKSDAHLATNLYLPFLCSLPSLCGTVQCNFRLLFLCCAGADCAVLQAALNWRACSAKVRKGLAGFQGRGLHVLLWVFLPFTARKASQIVSVLFSLC